LRRKRSVGGYLAFLSVKYEVDPEKFFAALRQAGENKKTNCGQFSIECRGKIKTKQIFLIRNDSGIVAQFRVSDDFFLESGNSLRKFMDTDMVRKHLFKKRKATHSHFIRDVRPGMNHVNLKAKILEVAEPRRVVTRYGNYANVAKALIADETGTIKLCLWNEQIDSVCVGDTVQIGNARASTFRGERQLTLGIRGVLTSAEVFESQMAAPVCPQP
jgi:replication factor A1